MKKLFKSMVPEPFMLMMCLLVFANLSIIGKKKESQGDAGTTITLVTSGTGNTKEEATKNALRSALEQTYGAFVSANSQVVNDELVRDEIVSISTGNIVSYDVLSFIDSNPKQITLKAVVSISKLQKYAQNKGMSAELAGNTFAMNMKIEELNIQNENKALLNLIEQINLNTSRLFDYKIDVGNPQKIAPQGVKIPITYNVIVNKNTIEFYKMIHGTLSSLAISQNNSAFASNGLHFPKTGDSNSINYVLRSGDHNRDNIGVGILRAIEKAAFNSEVVDNIGNVSSFIISETYERDYESKSCYCSNLGLLYVKPTNKLLCISRYYNDGRYSIDWWLGSKIPQEGAIVLSVKLEMHYNMDEISKISKIEVRPKKNNVMSNNAAQHFAQKKNVEKADQLLALKQIAKNYSDKEDYENAIVAYKKYLDACGEKASATDIAVLGQQYMYYAQQNPAQKIDALKKADDVFAKLAENPDAEEFATYKRAQVANQMDGGKGLAKPFYDKLIATPNCNIERLKEAYLYNISYFGNVKGDINAAIPYAEKLAKIDPNNQIAKVVLSLK